MHVNLPNFDPVLNFSEVSRPGGPHQRVLVNCRLIKNLALTRVRLGSLHFLHRKFPARACRLLFDRVIKSVNLRLRLNYLRLILL